MKILPYMHICTRKSPLKFGRHANPDQFLGEGLRSPSALVCICICICIYMKCSQVESVVFAGGCSYSVSDFELQTPCSDPLPRRRQSSTFEDHISSSMDLRSVQMSMSRSEPSVEDCTVSSLTPDGSAERFPSLSIDRPQSTSDCSRAQ